MPLTVDVDEAAARLPEMLAEVEAGRDVVISRGAEEVARMTKVEKPKLTPQEAIDAIIEARSRMPRATAEEILEWRDEGRR